MQALSELPRGEGAQPGCDSHTHARTHAHACAGEPIATRWSPEIKAEVKRSRVAATSKVAAAINACPPETRPPVLVSSSAVGFYGTSESQTFSETSGARGAPQSPA